MVPWTFSLNSAGGLADFVEYHAVLLPSSHAFYAWKVVHEHEVESLSRTDWLQRAREVGRITWGARQALKAYIEGEGAEQEYRLLLQAVQPATAVLLSRLAKDITDLRWNILLEQPNAYFALHEPQWSEISLVRPEVWLQVWRERQASFQEEQQMFDKEANLFSERLQEERALLQERGDSVAQERAVILQSLEDRVFLHGERVEIEAMESL